MENLTLYTGEEPEKHSCADCQYWWGKYERCCHSKAAKISTDEDDVCDLWEDRSE